MDLGSLPAGAYTGQILFKVDNQVKAALPVTLNVRDGGWIAALVLAGVALGLLVLPHHPAAKLRGDGAD